MRLATIKINDGEYAGIVTDKGVVTIDTVNKVCGSSWQNQMYERN